MRRDSPGTSKPYGRRLTLLRQHFAGAGVDALLVTHPPNLRYLVGFTGSLGALLVRQHGADLVVDGRYITSARERVADAEDLGDVTVQLAEGSLEDAVAGRVLSGSPIATVGVEATAMTLSRFDRLAEAIGRAESNASTGLTAPRLRATERLVERGRRVKDEGEIAILREAAARLSGVARAVFPLIGVERSEQEIAIQIESALRHAGFERLAFETIVASGPNSALPHARPGPRRLQPGDGVLLDFGGVYDGYCVDLTRTVQLAPLTDEFRRLWEAVRAAHRAALEAVSPGAETGVVDRAAREELARHGLAERFPHGTGHGLGLEVHEEPRLTRPGFGHPADVLEAGMVFTIEPGVYAPGLGGVRIEDDVLVVETGCELLTDVPIDPACGAR